MFFKISRQRILEFFLQNLHFFIFSTFIVIIQVFPGPGARKLPKVFDNKLLTKFNWPCNGFQLFNVTNFSNFFFIKLAFFENFFVIFDFFSSRVL